MKFYFLNFFSDLSDKPKVRESLDNTRQLCGYISVTIPEPMSASLPSFLNKYFWDVDTKTLDLSEKPLFIIQRLLDKGDRESASWVLRHFDIETIKEAFMTLRDFNPKVGYFWKLFLNIPESKVVCLQKPYQKMRKSHWLY